jgi:hypothetical protein
MSAPISACWTRPLRHFLNWVDEVHQLSQNLWRVAVGQKLTAKETLQSSRGQSVRRELLRVSRGEV